MSFEVTLPELSLIPIADGEDELLWVNVVEIKEAKLKPDFLVYRLETLPEILEHHMLYDN